MSRADVGGRCCTFQGDSPVALLFFFGWKNFHAVYSMHSLLRPWPSMQHTYTRTSFPKLVPPDSLRFFKILQVSLWLVQVLHVSAVLGFLLSHSLRFCAILRDSFTFWRIMKDSRRFFFLALSGNMNSIHLINHINQLKALSFISKCSCHHLLKRWFLIPDLVLELINFELEHQLKQ